MTSNIQNLLGRVPVQPALGGPALAEGLDCMISRGFCDPVNRLISFNSGPGHDMISCVVIISQKNMQMHQENSIQYTLQLTSQRH